MRRLVSIFTVVRCSLAAIASAANSLAILPEEIKMTGPAARQPLIVESLREHQFIGQITNGVEFVSSDTNVVRIENGVVMPARNGTATIRASAGKQVATVRVTVEGMDKPFEWSFRNHVQPVLAKNGCSAGACHGAAAGQNGFKLSLRGYDDEGDFLTLTHGALGRRIVPSDPGRSLMLLKPSGALPHKGGKRFDVDSLDYRVLAEWIEAGTPAPKKEDPRIEKIEILPEQAVLQPKMSQQLIVRAWFSDGHSEDVTRWAKYTSANETVAQIGEQGNVTVSGFGEGAITAWYLSRIAIATITVPYTNNVSSELFAKATRRNFIDDLVLEKLERLKVPPSPRCSDQEFIRRAFIDTTGVLPSPQETREFLESKASDKRDQLIEA